VTLRFYRPRPAFGIAHFDELMERTRSRTLLVSIEEIGNLTASPTMVPWLSPGISNLSGYHIVS
jgi:hypothetical protein